MANHMPLINDAMVEGMIWQSEGTPEALIQAQAWFEKSKRDFERDAEIDRNLDRGRNRDATARNS